jgi:hypothetical protein
MTHSNENTMNAYLVMARGASDDIPLGLFGDYYAAKRFARTMTEKKIDGMKELRRFYSGEISEYYTIDVVTFKDGGISGAKVILDIANNTNDWDKFYAEGASR